MSTTPLRVVLLIVGAALLLSVMGVIGLQWEGKPIPDVLEQVITASIVGLLALLVPTRSNDQTNVGR